MATRESDDLPTLDVASRGTKFVDNEGRTLTLRGVNLGGAKLPAGYRLAGAFERAPTFDAETGVFRLEFRADHDIKAPTEIFIPEVVQYPEGFVVELSDGDYTLERAPDAVGGYCVLRYTPGPPGYVSIVVVKRAGADDPGAAAAVSNRWRMRGSCRRSRPRSLISRRRRLRRQRRPED